MCALGSQQNCLTDLKLRLAQSLLGGVFFDPTHAVTYRRAKTGRIGPGVMEAIGSTSKEALQFIRVASTERWTSSLRAMASRRNGGWIGRPWYRFHFLIIRTRGFHSLL